MWDKKGENIGFKWFYSLREEKEKEEEVVADAKAALQKMPKEKAAAVKKKLDKIKADKGEDAMFNALSQLAAVLKQAEEAPQFGEISVNQGECRYKKAGNTRRTRELMNVLGFSYTEGKKGRINIDSNWQKNNIVKVALHNGKTVRIHRLVASNLAEAFKKASEVSGYKPTSVQTQVARHMLWDPSKPVSNHSYGLSVDFDPSDNPYGKVAGEVRNFPQFINIMNCYGWLWGGDWTTPDDMHFEFDVTRLK